MRTKKEKKPVRDWSNICHYSSDILKVKNLNEIYRHVYYKPKEIHTEKGCAEWVYIDVSLDDLINGSEMSDMLKITSAKYDFVIRLRCTGIKDKFENLIFEGDITEIKFTGQISEKGCVTFDTMSGHYSKGCTDIGSYKKQTEIIGDIFQAPELDWRWAEHLKEFGLEEMYNIKSKKAASLINREAF